MLSPDKLNDLRRAAEYAWGDDTRDEGFVGHPDPSAGQCFVTSQWMAHKLGGYVGTKKGHYFWVSPDREHVVDLTGDWFTRPPLDESIEGKPLDEHDEPWTMDPEHKRHMPGPVMYKRATHPLWKGFRIVNDYPDHERAQLFERRADVALRHRKTADLIGADPYQGETEQKKEDWEMQAPFIHDELDNDEPGQEPITFKWVVANGQVHVSPEHSHEELAGHTGVSLDDTGPFASGYVELDGKHAKWYATSNMSMHRLNDVLSNFSDTAGWKYDGLYQGDKQVFGARKKMWYKERDDGHLLLSERPLPHAKQIRIDGKTAYVKMASDALTEWANDFGYRLAEYPGDPDAGIDQVKNREHLELYDRGDMKFQPERDDPDLAIENADLTCKCGYEAHSLNDLRAHHKYEHETHEDPLVENKFPWPHDTDDPLGFGTQPVQQTAWDGVVAFVLPKRLASRYSDFDEWRFAKSDDRFYGVYTRGQLVGYGVADRKTNAPLHIEALSSELEQPIRQLMTIHAKGQEPKDLIEAPIPFVYDSGQGTITLGYPGTTPHEVQGRFTPGGIQEGYYHPGGKVEFTTHTYVPTTLYSFAQLWYNLYPQMEISGVEQMGPEGKTEKLATQKLAAEEVGNYVKSMMATDDAAVAAYRALQAAGGKVYVVGGAVRDAMRGQMPKDFDLLVANLPPKEVKHILGQLPGNVNEEGSRFGIFRYKLGHNDVEVALPRQDKYDISRRSRGVVNVDPYMPVEKDLERRDFTANSMAVDLNTGQLIDPYNGTKDLNRNVLRTTHANSFREDPTRLVRALVAHSRFGLNPDERTRQEMVEHGHLLRQESPDSLNKVLDKLFESQHPASGIRLAHDTGVLRHLFPEVDENWNFDQNNKHHSYLLGDHLMHVLDNVSRISTDPDVRMMAMAHDIGKPESEWRDPEGLSHYYQNEQGQGANHELVGAHKWEDRLRALNYPVARIKRQVHGITHHMFPAFSSPKGARKFINRVGDEHADDLLNLREADMMGKGQTPEEIAARTPVNHMRELVNSVRQNQEPTGRSQLAISGYDVLNLGAKPGPFVGWVLNELANAVIDNPNLNTREQLSQMAQQYIQAQPE